MGSSMAEEGRHEAINTSMKGLVIPNGQDSPRLPPEWGEPLRRPPVPIPAESSQQDLLWIGILG